MFFSDTIAAIATPAGSGSIGIIRISGPGAFGIIKKLTPKRTPAISDHLAVHTVLVDPSSGEELDEVIYTAFKSPASYTGEDVVEISCHGSSAVLQKTLHTVLACGTRLAEPGEFTKRAFLNGKMDLVQAEAVNDLIRSRTESARRSSLGQLRGGLSSKLADVDNALLELVAAIEASIDFPDDVGEPDLRWVREYLSNALRKLQKLESTYKGGRILREGAKVVICGSVNVGKSSLLNALLKYERAIVTPIPGTTRDTIEESLEIGGIPITAIDTAGIRDTDDLVETIGLNMARSSIEEADLALLVVDASRSPEPEDISAVSQADPDRCILVANKMDVVGEGHVEAYVALVQKELGKSLPLALVSAVNETGIDILEDRIYDKLSAGEHLESVLVTNARHYTAINSSAAVLLRALEELETGVPFDLLCIGIAEARRQIGLVTGETIEEDVLDRIFSQFCIGK